jgi:S-adenosylmethionine:tRNA ribosyltransferase-isomerase
LHFTPELLKELVEYGVDIAEITLHVGLGTFRPVDVDTVEEHQMHHEEYFVKKEIADKIFMAKKEGRRIIAVGTTSIRVLETIADLNRDENGGFSGSTDIFIYPPYQFKMVDALITNFHLPKSTLLILLSAFADREFIMSAYQTAINEKYRFYSFGDACLIL